MAARVAARLWRVLELPRPEGKLAAMRFMAGCRRWPIILVAEELTFRMKAKGGKLPVVL
jgi:hypothetical protein